MKKVWSAKSELEFEVEEFLRVSGCGFREITYCDFPLIPASFSNLQISSSSNIFGFFLK
jgi:hypothetical protein